MGEFHSKDGLFFERLENGSVKVSRETGQAEGVDGAGQPASASFRSVVTLDAGTWASVVASVSARGETAVTFREAEAFHAGNL